MPLTPLDIHNKEFRRSVRGYSEQEVDDFLDEVVREFEHLIKENLTLKGELESLAGRVDQYRQMEETLQKTLVVAQEAAEQVKANARKEAELILREAEAQGRRVVQAAEERVREEERRLEALRREMQVFRARMRSLVESQLEYLSGDSRWPDEAAREAAAAQEEPGPAT